MSVKQKEAEKDVERVVAANPGKEPQAGVVPLVQWPVPKVGEDKTVEESRKGPDVDTEDTKEASRKELAVIDPAEANIILDAIFTRGIYEEEVVLPRGHKCVFATRTTKQAKEILSRLEEDNPTRMMRYNQLYSCYCLAASLKSFDGRVMPELFDEKIKVTELWAGPLVDILLGELVKFDDKVASAYTTEQAKN